MTDLYTTPVPAWISITFGIFFLTIPALLIGNAVKKSLEKAGQGDGSRMRTRIFIFYLAYFFLVALVSLSGFFQENTLPPRIIVCTTVPLFLFYALIVRRKSWFKTAFANVSIEQLVFIHLFRFVGAYFFLVYFYGALPKAFAFIGGTGDVLTAALIFPVIYLLKKKVAFAKAAVWIWNIIGILDIFSVLVTAIVTTQIAVSTNGEGVAQFGTFPFSWIPAFAPATIIFLHLLIFWKLIKEKHGS